MAEILINLNDSEGDKAFSGSEIIHREEMKTLSEITVEKVNDKLPKDNQNIFNTIFVNGKRGTGKSSFIKTFKNFLENKFDKNDDKTIFFKDSFNNAEVLEILDPTLIEDKVHIFITIISLIKSVVDKKINKDLTKDSDIYSKKDWEKSLENLSEGLPFIDGLNKANPTYWDDSWQIFQKGISSANSAFTLKKNFEEFVSKSLSILGKTTFILFIDDVDTDFSKSFPLLETLRKYLSTNKIITILTGDLDLLATSVRKRQWENFTKSLLINEADKTSENRNKYNKSVTELVEQYLLKVLPAKNRIRLRTLKEIGDEKIEVKYKINETEKDAEDDKNKAKDSNEIKIEEFIESTLKNYGIENAYQRKAFTDLIYSLPIRTQIEFFRFLNDNDITRLNDIFYAELWKNNININFLMNQPELLCSSILKYLVGTKKLNEFYQLQPVSSVEEENIILLVFTLCFSKLVKDNPILIFDLFIKIGYLRNLLLKYPYEASDTNSKESNKNFTELLRISSFFENIELRQQVCYSVAFQRSFEKNKENSFLAALALKDDEFQKILKAEKVNPIALLPAFYTKGTTANTIIRNYSFFALVGAIFDLISETDSGVSFENAILRITQVRTYSGAENSEEQDDNTDDELEKLTVDKDKLETLTSLFATWKESLKEIKIAPYSISKISTRICNAFENIGSKNRNNNLAEIMNLLVCEFFNAVLIEESLEKDFGEKISRNNIVNSTKCFTDNLKAVSKKSDLLLTNAMISCPILLCFVKDDVITELKEFSKDIDVSAIKNLSLFETLKTVYLFGKKPAKGPEQPK